MQQMLGRDAYLDGLLGQREIADRPDQARDYDARSDLHHRGFEQPIGQRAHRPDRACALSSGPLCLYAFDITRF